MESTAETQLSDWFEGPLGARVLREEAALAMQALDNVFGFELLQVGAWGPKRHLLDGARTQHTTLLAPELTAGVTLCAPLDTLPFRSDSIDAIFLPHTLELVEDPYAVLREAERVLTGEGCLLICGFNPFSGWGARRSSSPSTTWPTTAGPRGTISASSASCPVAASCRPAPTGSTCSARGSSGPRSRTPCRQGSPVRR